MLASLLLSALTALPSAGDRGTQPNVLLILADDIGTDRIAAYGEHANPGRTPVLDQLAADGALFRNAWAAPVCGPSRATVITGRHGYRTGVGWNISYLVDGPIIGVGGPDGLPLTEQFLPRLLQTNGYRSSVIGKWHLANNVSGDNQHPILTGFQIHAGALILGGYHNWKKNLAGWGGNMQFNEPEYSPKVNVDDVLTVIEANGDDPWFLWFAPLSAHKPAHNPPAELLSPETQAVLASGTATEADQHRAMVEAMDAEIGRLLDSMDPDVRDNTWVIFMADNGTYNDAIELPKSTKGAKGSLFEGGIKVPLIISGPGIVEPGREIDELACSVDLFSTVLDMAGVPLPTEVPIDGKSLLPLLTDPEHGPVRRFAYAEKFRPNGFSPKELNIRVVRDERYKLRQTLKPLQLMPFQFHDLLSDPLEEVDLLGEGLPPLDREAQAAFERLLAHLEAIDA